MRAASSSGDDVSDVRDVVGEDAILVVPGIRPAGSNGHDQVRILTPEEAIERGADYLVVGRAIFLSRAIRRRSRARSSPAFADCSASGKPQVVRLYVALLPPRGVTILAGFGPLSEGVSSCPYRC